MTVAPAKHSFGRDARFSKPAAQRAERADCLFLPKVNGDLAADCLLGGLRAVQSADQAILGEGEISTIDRGKLRTAEGAGEAQENQRAVAEARKRLGAAGADPANVGG